MWYAAGWNMPGYLPEMDPFWTEDLEEAYQYLIDEIRDEVQSREGEIGDVYTVSLDEVSHNLSWESTAPVIETVIARVEPYVYWIQCWEKKPEGEDADA